MFEFKQFKAAAIAVPGIELRLPIREVEVAASVSAAPAPARQAVGRRS